jgi:hypothetical protein
MGHHLPARLPAAVVVTMAPSAPDDAPPAEARTSGGGERVSTSGASAAGAPRTSRASASAASSSAAAAGAAPAAARCRVVARFRPLTAREAESGERCVDCGVGNSGGSSGGSSGAATSQVSVIGASAEPLPFAFDAVLPERASQEEVFACVARETADRVQQGYNGAFAFARTPARARSAPCGRSARNDAQ